MIANFFKQGGLGPPSLPFLSLLILFIQLNGVTCSRLGYPQFVKISQSFLKAQVGDDVQLECELNPTILDEYEDIRLEWLYSSYVSLEEIYSVSWNKLQEGDNEGVYTKNGLDGTSVQLTRDAFTLYLDRVQPTQEGSYICKVSDNKGLEVEEECFVDVRKPKKVEEGEIVTYDIDQNVQLVCVDMEQRAFGEVSGNVIWRKNGVVVAKDPELKIFKVDKDDEGEYHCIVEGNIQRNVTVRVDNSPKVFIKSRKVLQHPGYPAQLACSVHSYEVPIINWYKEEIRRVDNNNHTSSTLKQITNMTFITEFVEGGIRSILEFENVTKSSYGLYTCNASTYHGTDSKELRLMYSPTPVLQSSFAPSTHMKQPFNSFIIPTFILCIIQYRQYRQ